MDRKNAKKLDAESAKKLPKELLDKIGGGDDIDWDEYWYVDTTFPCPNCGAMLYACESEAGLEYYYCLNYPCRYTQAWNE